MENGAPPVNVVDGEENGALPVNVVDEKILNGDERVVEKNEPENEVKGELATILDDVEAEAPSSDSMKKRRELKRKALQKKSATGNAKVLGRKRKLLASYAETSSSSESESRVLAPPSKAKKQKKSSGSEELTTPPYEAKKKIGSRQTAKDKSSIVKSHSTSAEGRVLGRKADELRRLDEKTPNNKSRSVPGPVAEGGLSTDASTPLQIPRKKSQVVAVKSESGSSEALTKSEVPESQFADADVLGNRAKVGASDSKSDRRSRLSRDSDVNDVSVESMFRRTMISNFLLK